MMRTVLLHNPSAGDGRPGADEILAALRGAGLAPSYRSTKGADLAEALREPADLVVVAGGDGTVAEVVTAVPDRSVPVAILPLGTANNVARSLGLAPGDLHDLAAGWRTARPRPLDVGVAAGPWGRRRFVEGVGLGARARAMALAGEAEAGEKLRRGRDAFRRALAEAAPLPVRIVLDGRELPGPLLLIEALNIAYAGPALRLAPEADPGDGLLDAACLGPERRDAALAWLAAPDRGAAPVVVRRGRALRIEWDGAPLRVDDELPSAPGRACTIEVALEPRPATVLVPAA